VKGVVYIAYGEPARKEAAESIKSLRQHHDWPVAVIGEKVLDIEPIRFRDKGEPGRWAKVHLDKLSPFEPTLYLDADTRINGDISLGFDILTDGWDLIIILSKMQNADWLSFCSAEERVETMNAAEGAKVCTVGGGVFWFRRNERTQKLFEVWRKEWNRWQGQDQGALIRALVQCPVRMWLLSREFNGGPIIKHRFGKAKQRRR